MQHMVSRLQDPCACVQLMFMHEYSILLSHCSKHAQCPQHLPPTRKKSVIRFKDCVKKAQEAFEQGSLPAIQEIKWSEKVNALYLTLLCLVY